MIIIRGGVVEAPALPPPGQEPRCLVRGGIVGTARLAVLPAQQRARNDGIQPFARYAA